jgi:hypothetical protein
MSSWNDPKVMALVATIVAALSIIVAESIHNPQRELLSIYHNKIP